MSAAAQSATALSICAFFAGFACTDGDSTIPPFEPMRPPPPPPITVSTPLAPAPPEAPDPPVTTPCADGWREVIDEGARAGEPPIIVCDPWPERGREECPRGAAHFPGEAGCRAVGAPCPAGSFAEDLPATDVLYVFAGAGLGGDGSIASPFATIGEAVRIASAGTTIAVGKGRYDEAIELLTPGITIAGACVAETELVMSEYVAGRVILHVDALDAAIRNVRMTGMRTAVRVGPGPSSLQMDGVAIEDIAHLGIAVEGIGAEIFARDVIVRDVRESPERPDGIGILSRNGGRITLERAAIERTVYITIAASTGTVTIDRAVVRAGITMLAGDGSSFTARALVAEDLDGTALSAGETSDVRLTDSLIRRTSLHAVPGQGEVDGGLTLFGSHAILERTTIEGTHTDGIQLNEASDIRLEDCVIRDIAGDTRGGILGTGMVLLGGSSATVSRVAILRARSGALGLQGASAIDAEDLIIRDTHASTNGNLGAAILASEESRVTVRRGAFARNRSHGVLAHGEGVTVDLEDVTISDTRETAVRSFEDQIQDGKFGYAVEAALGASMTISRARFAHNRETGMSIVFESNLVASDLVVEDTTTNDLGVLGRGLSLHSGSHATIERARFANNREVGIFVAESALAATDVVIDGTLSRKCAEYDCRDQPAGVGISSAKSSIDMQRFLVRGNALAGLQIAFDGAMDLFDGEISGNPIGANIQADNFNPRRISNRVIFRDNELNVDGVPIEIETGLAAAVVGTIPGS